MTTSTNSWTSFEQKDSPSSPAQRPIKLDGLRIPRHVAIIMDGNGRWAGERGWNRSIGHMQGASRVKQIIQCADELGIQVLTLYAFSTENWKRPDEEISTLMNLIRDYVLQERDELHASNIRFQVLGEIEKLPTEVKNILIETIETTKNNTGRILNFCLSYGGRSEIVHALRDICNQVKEGKVKSEDISEDLVSKSLFTKGLPDPDLVIRTSGEFRVSNFLLWQIAYAEIFVSDVLWPDFEASHFRSAILWYSQRKRRFGLSDEVHPGV